MLLFGDFCVTTRRACPPQSHGRLARQCLGFRRSLLCGVSLRSNSPPDCFRSLTRCDRFDTPAYILNFRLMLLFGDFCVTTRLSCPPRRIGAKLRLRHSACFAPCFGRYRFAKTVHRTVFTCSPVVIASIPLRIFILRFTLNYNIIVLAMCQYFFVIFSFLGCDNSKND